MKNLDTTLSMFPEKVLETADDFVWKVVGSDERNIPLVEARYNGSTVGGSDTGVGAGRGVIELVFEEKYFSDVHIIAGIRPDTYQYRIISDAVEDGGNFVYEA